MLKKVRSVCEPVCMFLRPLGLLLTLTAHGRLLQSSPRPGLVVPESNGKEKWHCAYSRVVYSGL